MAGSIGKPSVNADSSTSARSKVANRWKNVNYKKLGEDIVVTDTRAKREETNAGMKVESQDIEVVVLDSDSDEGSQDDTSIEEQVLKESSAAADATANPRKLDDKEKVKIDSILYESDYCFKLMRSTVYDSQYETMSNEQKSYFITTDDIFNDPKLSSTFLFSYQYDMNFILSCFHKDLSDITMVMQRGCIVPLDIKAPEKLQRLHDKIKYVEVDMPSYTSHHSKMILNFYSDKSMRIFMPSNNFTEAEITYPQQVCWCSPKLRAFGDKKLVDDIDDASCFRAELFEYIGRYRHYLFTQRLIGDLSNYDFSSLNGLHFLFSTPRRFAALDSNNKNTCDEESGLVKFGSVVRRVESDNTKINKIKKRHYLVQTSSIGTKRLQGKQLFTGFMIPNLTSSKNVCGHILYPTLQEVCDSPASLLSGGWFHFNYNDYSEPYISMKKQNLFVKQNPIATSIERRATPSHSKFYMKWTSDDENDVSIPDTPVDWCLYTSANLSIAAWGTDVKSATNFEVGVLIPGPINVFSFVDLIYKATKGTRLGTSDDQGAHIMRDSTRSTVIVPFPKSLVPYSYTDNDKPTNVALLDKIRDRVRRLQEEASLTGP
ncbi:similar to Saccharomyces cerevisiae YBR223C TDP1 Tyrosyl-DNA Phosphodiesterase I [Maudiozyma barnettii]|uniref:Similar to Saccharomyces cerevisiae YBR223C TDP1 Tyrosyl-DNA Phosphodiesterase I n=1 Tax=Maudiozyma barnettii TaxID=61262 RepID=A0A8H2ZJN3_9SACH|nr:tyrosyl-DNA phosphodiesterase 1 [Kazachstania barnettii]CAB4254407.1 similar to Saccharomyces cerevisiae YBR223C TDP1 Tyrosyl-DNA Phosphodiesterase I [Kazachstania barnettii]CAD1782325.1 similar to Saccharomyces cerevisiae YBR223C TDP1 Tyrosyl-DNA Phosphodiesterase I [Kazachstania barnettii]